jgi:hypothetical protein
MERMPVPKSVPEKPVIATPHTPAFNMAVRAGLRPLIGRR